MRLRLRRIGVVALVVVLATAALLEAQSAGVNDQEIQRFTLPGSNTTGFRVHGSSAAMNLTLPAGDILASGGYKVAYTYAHSENIVVNTSGAAVPVAGTVRASTSTSATTGVPFQTVPSAGSIIGVAIGARSALTRDAAHTEATILRNGATVTTGLRALIGAGLTYTQYAVTTQARGTDVFYAGEGVGCNVTIDSLITPTANQIVCTVIVSY